MAEDTQMEIRKLEIAWEMTKTVLVIVGDQGSRVQSLESAFPAMYKLVAATLSEVAEDSP